MKFILSFLFAFIFISPVMATVTESCAVISTNASGCSLGCADTTGLGEECYPCLSGYYNNGTFTDGCHSCYGDPDYEAIQQDQTKQHPRGASSCSDWICAEGWTQVGQSCQQCPQGSLPDGATYPATASGCDDWMCRENFYVYPADTGSSNRACYACPGEGTTDSMGHDISGCSCGNNADGQQIIANSNNESGYESPYFCGTCGDNMHYDNFSCVCDIQNANYDSLTLCSCPEDSNNVDGTCVCQGQRVMVLNSQGQYECRSCAANAEYVDGACRCRAGYYGDGQTSCAPCPNGSVTVVNGSCGCSEGVTDGVCGDENCPGAAGATEISHCQCKQNYYKVGDANAFSCSLCPAGTFSDLNSSGIGSCQMNHNTQFCDANGANCMQLIPES